MSIHKEKTSDVDVLNPSLNTSLLGGSINDINHRKDAGVICPENVDRDGDDDAKHNSDLEADVINPHFVNQPPPETLTHKIQSTNLYWTINNANEKGKFLQDVCDACSQEVSKLPAKCVAPCHKISIGLFVVVLLMYLISIFMACPYSVNTMKYKDIDGLRHTTSILVNDIKDDSTVDALYNENVCQFYNMNCTLLHHKNKDKLNKYTNDISLTKLSDYDIGLIKVQWIVSWVTWLEIRVNMLDTDLVCDSINNLNQYNGHK